MNTKQPSKGARTAPRVKGALNRQQMVTAVGSDTLSYAERHAQKLAKAVEEAAKLQATQLKIDAIETASSAVIQAVADQDLNVEEDAQNL